MTPMSLAWVVLKSPLRGTQGLYFDNSQQAGAFSSRFGVSGPQGTVHGVWAAGTDDPLTPFQYAMGQGDLGPGHQPMVHTMPQQGAVMQQPGTGYTPALRYDRSDFPEGVPTQGAQTVWRGPSFQTYMDHPSVRPEQKNMQGYRERMARDYARSLAQFYQNQGGLPYQTQPENVVYPQQNPAERWRTLSRVVPGEAGEWMRRQSGVESPTTQVPSNREGILEPTLTGNEVPYYMRERSNIPSAFDTPSSSWMDTVFPDQRMVGVV